MSTLPAQGDLEAVTNNLDMKAEFENLRDCMAEVQGFSALSALTIASGAITPPDGAGGGTFTVDTEGLAASDILSSCTLTNVPEGRIIRIYGANAARVVTVEHGSGASGEWLLADSADFVLDATDKWVEFQRRSTSMVEWARGYGVDKASERLHLGVPKQISHNTLCPHRNLTGVWATNATATFTADELVLEDVDGNQFLIESFNKTVNIATAGIGGLDTGSEASSTWYYVFAVAKSDGTQDIVLSLADDVASLTFSGGYSYAGLISALRNNGSSNFVDFRQLGALIDIDATQCLTAGTATSDTSLNAGSGTVTALSTMVPALARKVQGYARVSDSGSSASAVTIKPVTGSNIGRKIINNPGGSTSTAGGYFEALMSTAQTLYYQVSAGDSAEIFVTGFEF